MKYLLFICLILLAFNSYSQNITRGPDVGEIYFLGPTVTVFDQAIYRSINFGASVICMDSIAQANNLILAISADKETGNIYFSTILEQLYHSENYGQTGTWVHKSNNVYPYLLSGVISGYVFEYCMKHSEDFGNSFINHTLSGYFGVVISSELDVHNGIGYTILKYWGQDTLYFMKTDDYFENLEFQNKFVESHEPLNFLSRGFNSGELFSFIENENSMIRFSNDFGYSWTTKNRLYFNNYFNIGFTGGRQTGELYLLVTYIQLAGQIKHIRIYHSMDYGESFTIHHPFSYGPEPFYVGFDAEPSAGTFPLSVQFIDASSGEELSFEWDFQNDGTTDSYEQNPTFIYPDTGYYDVKLTVTNPFNEYSLVKEKLIHVKDTLTILKDHNYKDLRFYPNPFFDHITFEFYSDKINSEICIYDLTGQLINTLQKPQGVNKLIWDGRDKNGNKCESGIYFVRTENNSFSKKILLIK